MRGSTRPEVLDRLHDNGAELLQGSVVQCRNRIALDWDNAWRLDTSGSDRLDRELIDAATGRPLEQCRNDDGCGDRYLGHDQDVDKGQVAMRDMNPDDVGERVTAQRSIRADQQFTLCVPTFVAIQPVQLTADGQRVRG